MSSMVPCAPSNITLPPSGENVVEQAAGVGDKGAHLLGGRGVLVVHLRGVERVGAEERVGDGVLLRAGGFDVGLEQVGAQQVDDAQAAARHLVFVGGADAAAGGADLLAAGRALSGQLDHAVVGQDDLGAVGDEELLVDCDAELAQLGHFAEEGDGIEHHAVADDAFAARAQHAAGNELQHEFLPANDDGVAGVVAARVTRHGAEPLAQHVHNLAFALVAPLGAQHYRRLRSHVRMDSRSMPRQLWLKKAGSCVGDGEMRSKAESLYDDKPPGGGGVIASVCGTRVADDLDGGAGDQAFLDHLVEVRDELGDLLFGVENGEQDGRVL